MSDWHTEFNIISSVSGFTAISPCDIWGRWWAICVAQPVCETSAGCLRSIYPSLGRRQLFGDVTIGQWRHNKPTQLYDPIIHLS